MCARARFSVIFSFLKFILFIPMLLFRHCHSICYSASITDTIRCILFYSTVPSLSLYSGIAIPSLSLYLRFRCSAIFILFQCCFSVTDPLCCVPSLSFHFNVAIPPLTTCVVFRCSVIVIPFQCCYSVTDPLCCIPLFRHCHSISVLLFRH